jgi:hypothetical protein
MKITKSKLKDIIREELLREDAEEFKMIQDSIGEFLASKLTLKQMQTHFDKDSRFSGGAQVTWFRRQKTSGLNAELITGVVKTVNGAYDIEITAKTKT